MDEGKQPQQKAMFNFHNRMRRFWTHWIKESLNSQEEQTWNTSAGTYVNDSATLFPKGPVITYFISGALGKRKYTDIWRTGYRALADIYTCHQRVISAHLVGGVTIWGGTKWSFLSVLLIYLEWIDSVIARNPKLVPWSLRRAIIVWKEKQKSLKQSMTLLP